MKPISEKQLEANRRNAQKSTGPRAEAGKERSRLNAFRHHITGQGDRKFSPPKLPSASVNFRNINAGRIRKARRHDSTRTTKRLIFVHPPAASCAVGIVLTGQWLVGEVDFFHPLISKHLKRPVPIQKPCRGGTSAPNADRQPKLRLKLRYHSCQAPFALASQNLMRHSHCCLSSFAVLQSCSAGYKVPANSSQTPHLPDGRPAA
jgi:hypothetical protein